MNGPPSPIRRNVPRFGGDRLVPHARLAGPMPWAITVSVIMIAMTHGIGPASRAWGTRRSPPKRGTLRRIGEGAPLMARPPRAAADSAAHRSDRRAARDRAA